MIPHAENKGGLLGQLRGVALRGSDNGRWLENTPQRMSLERTSSVAGVDESYVRVRLDALKAYEKRGERRQLVTRYILSGTLIYDQLVKEEVPQFVIDAMHAKRLVQSEDVEASKIAWDSTKTEVEAQGLAVLEDFDDSDSIFRFERSLLYRLNGRGEFETETRSEQFFEIDDGDELATDLSVTTSLKVNALHQLLDGEEDEITKLPPTHDIEHPDLLQLELNHDTQELQNDLEFAEIIDASLMDKTLREKSRTEHLNAALSLLAFLRLECNTNEITRLL